MFLYGRLSGILEESVLTDMNIIAHHRADLAETYIEGRCDFLSGYARSSEAINALSHPDDPAYIKAARNKNVLVVGGSGDGGIRVPSQAKTA